MSKQYFVFYDPPCTTETKVTAVGQMAGAYAATKELRECEGGGAQP